MRDWRALPRGARGYVLAVSTCGLTASALVLAVLPPTPDVTLLGFVLLGAMAALLRVPLPRSGTLSLGYAFVLGALLAGGPGASVATALVSALLVAAVPGGRSVRSPLHRIGFNVGLVGLCTTLATTVYLKAGGHVGRVEPVQNLGPLLAYAVVFAIGNLSLIAAADALAAENRFLASLRANLPWSIPAYAAGTSLAVLLAVIVRFQGFTLLPLAAPFVWLLHTTYRARVAREDEERRHAKQTAALYRSVTEALALAIEAKDESTEEHLRRVQRHTLELGRRLSLPAGEMEALEAAALLHDIGKIAVPEHILSKPGRLTPQETERMRIHPRVGAEILSAVPFPYPLASIVRHHHERWDGSGYPDGLSGQAIPIGARILAVVDCFDALTVDRPYRKALPREEAIGYLQQESGRMFDPAIVDLFVSSVDVWNSSQIPDAPIRALPMPALAVPPPLTTPAGALRGARDPMLPWPGLVARMVPFATFAVYLRSEDGTLRPRLAVGLGAPRLAGFSVRRGERVVGWVALQGRPYVGVAHVRALERDGSRWDFEDFADDPELGLLRSTVAVPLQAEDELAGVLALYHLGSRPYGEEDLSRLLALAPEIARTLPSLPGSRVSR